MKTGLKPFSFKGIRGNVFDGENGNALPARIIISNDTGIVSQSYYSKLPGFFTEENGSFQQVLEPGNYSIEVFHGIEYLSQKIPFTISSEKGVEAKVYLKQWFPLKKRGWFNGDGHDHLYTEIKKDTAMLALVRKICLAQGIDFVCAAQGWAGYNDSNWREGYSEFTDNQFTIHYGSEMPKYRTGHTWWLGQNSNRNYFWSTMDTTYENQYYQSDHGTTWNFKQLPFPNIPDVEVVQRFKTADSSLAIMAHPTSWWMQKRGDIEKYVTNVAVNLSFGLLSGKIWDGIVAMGYDHDHYFYQNLWFNILNQGYRMPAFSELDGGLGRDDKFYYGSMRTYFHMDGAFSIKKMMDAAKKGRSFLTSGPIIMADVDGKYTIGDVVPSDVKNHVLNIRAYASGEKDDYLSYIIVYRNGKIFKLWDIRNKKNRKFSGSLSITEKDRAWYIVKVYGKNAWKNHSTLDIMRMCEKKQADQMEYRQGENDVAFTNPFYFWRKGDKDPEVLESKIDLTVIAPGSRQPINDGSIDIMVAGKTINTIKLSHGNAKFSMPVNAFLKINASGYPAVYRSLYLDYPPHLALLEELASGNWKNKYDTTIKFNPGEVPWKEFNFEKTKKILSDVKWNIELISLPRDGVWGEFEGRFEKVRGEKSEVRGEKGTAHCQMPTAIPITPFSSS